MIKGFRIWSPWSTSFLSYLIGVLWILKERCTLRIACLWCFHSARQLFINNLWNFTRFTLLLRFVSTSKGSSPFSLKRQHWILVTYLQLVHLRFALKHVWKLLHFIRNLCVGDQSWKWFQNGCRPFVKPR